ncbi:MAG: HAMP domain-containing histidine kinase [Alphaproteobacteria bacterium]|jgi:signal transduction histidine kinase|nr:HAMP domain-containing histidine kinase [Alphaproteobacteria bacterium]MBT4085816.1 HAMP domain-containing histidine kinase [Alphaproteobacteria bacterium]MBT4542711.1 HAMP domain-containing histidine kinase [Alphaproteobacteria bacterium]MBT7748169.1 HAMP domain-containing histidine kinase [Alphaproteobacteria bacterium]
MSVEQPSFGRFSGEFVDQTLEQEFRSTHFKYLARRARVFFLIVTLTTFSTVALISQSVHMDYSAWESSSGRLVVFVFALLFLVLSFRTTSGKQIDQMAAALYFSLLVVAWLYSTEIESTPVVLITRNLITVFLGYMIRPTRMIYVVGIGVLLSVFMVYEVIYVHEATRPEITAAISSVIVINIVGHHVGMVSDRNLRVNHLLHQQAERLAIDAEASRAAAVKANNSKSEFLAALNHELRNPLNSVVGFCEVLNQTFDEHTTDMQRESVEYISSAGKHMTEITDQVLDLARMESGHIELNPESVSVDAMVKNCVGLIDIEAKEHHLTSEIEVPAPSPVIWADATRARQVLLNLLTNAVKYNHDGGHITVKVQEVPQAIRISVSDTGEGIPPERYDELFEPFNRLEMEKGNIKGSGIGLSIARKIVEAMAGRMGVESVVGEGSTFWFELPLPVVETA